MSKTKVTVIGAGNMGSNHARVFESMGCLDSIVEINPARRELLRQTYGESKVVDSISQTNSDAYVIATPTIQHFKIAKSLLEKNKHLLIEKPVCMNVLEANELTKLAFNSGLVVAVGHVERFNPVVDYLAGWIADKPLKTIETYRLSAMPPQIKDVGVFKDLGIHDVDVVLSLVNSDIESIYAVSSEKNEKDVYTKTCITFKNGVHAFITASWLSTSKIRKIYVSTDHEDAEMDYLKQTFETKKINIDVDGNNFKPQHSHTISKIELKRTEPLLLQAKDFINSIEKNQKPAISIEQGARALEIVELSLESARKKVVVRL